MSFKTFIKFQFCCKHHRDLNDSCEKLTAQNIDLAQENGVLREELKKYKPSEGHCLESCITEDKVSTKVCTKCGEYEGYINLSKVHCHPNPYRVFREFNTSWSRRIISRELFNQLTEEKEEKERKQKLAQEVEILKSICKEPQK